MVVVWTESWVEVLVGVVVAWLWAVLGRVLALVLGRCVWVRELLMRGVDGVWAFVAVGAFYM